MYSRKEKKQWRSRIAEINLRFEEMATAIETEKRALTPEEVEERNALVQEKEILQLRLERSEHNPVSQQEVSQERAFAQTIAAMHGKCEIPEECRSLVNGTDMDIPINRDIQDTASAANVIPLTIGDIIQPLEKGLILSKVGMKMQYGMVGAWQFPIVAGVEATIEDENVEVNDTKIDIGKISPSPKRVTISIPVSNRAIDQSNGALLEIVRTQLPMSVSRVLNKWMFSPTRITSKASDGCFVNPKTKINATGNAWKDAITLKGKVMATGVIFDGTPAYVCSATKYAELESTPRDTGSGLMVIENGKINGFPVFMTEYIGEGILGFGVFSYELVGQFGKMRMTYDPYTGAKKNLVYFVFNSDYDMLTLRSEAFGTLKDKPTT
ncbi:phage major capsid protein [Parabacteroides gordonii]|uniref:phage major capsid protein n=1 Tax=Parabacteroides gordonii TaxID=574930 RepID=UPI000EF03BFB|nr:phage major capsid protein [Parabacteroides gordonii]RGP17279.1 phage major capsid protein [Parabacteroides gordonii]